MDYLILRQTVICKALEVLKLLKNDKDIHKLLSKEELDALPDIVEKETFKLVMLEKGTNK